MNFLCTLLNLLIPYRLSIFGTIGLSMGVIVELTLMVELAIMKESWGELAREYKNLFSLPDRSKLLVLDVLAIGDGY